MPEMLSDRTGVVGAKVFPRIPGERLTFELWLPRDCREVVGLSVQAAAPAALALLAPVVFPLNRAGDLSIEAGGAAGVLVQMPVDLGKSFEDNYAPLGLDHPAGWPGFTHLGMHGRRFEPLELKPAGKFPKLTCFYRDRVNALAGLSDTYLLQLFLYYRKHDH